MGPGLTRNFFFFFLNRPNIPKPVLIFWSSIPCVYTLLKVVCYYDLSVLSMLVWVSKKKNWMGGGWVGGGDLSNFV